MTRENKLALVIGFGLMLFVGILVSDHFSAQRFDPVSVAQKDPAPEPGAPTKLDEVAPGTLVAGNNPVDLTGQGTSALPEAPAGGEAPPVDGNPVDVHVADGTKPDGAGDGTPVRFHKVQKGETFWSIAAKEYGDGSLATALAKYNQKAVPDPTKLRKGVTLRLPPIEVLKPGAKPAQSKATATAQAPAPLPVETIAAADLTVIDAKTPVGGVVSVDVPAGGVKEGAGKSKAKASAAKKPKSASTKPATH